MGDQNPQDFAEKVLQSLKKSSRAVDLNDKPDPEPVQPVTQQSANRDFTAYFNQQEGGGQGPVTGGNKDLVIIPGLGGAASTSVSQINLYWSAPNIPDSTGIDSNVRATIYNFAVNPGVGVTIPVIVFGGYNGTQQYKPTPNYGGGTGVTARIWLNPFRGSLELDYVGFNATSSIAATTDIGFMSYDSTQNKIRVGVGVGAGSAKTVAFTDDITAASGAATTAQNIHMQLAGNAASHSIALSLQATGAGVALSSDAELTYNPSTNILSAGTFSGAHTGNLTGTATTAASVELRAGANAVNHSVVFSLNATGTGVGLSTDTALQYNPNSDTLSSTNFSGALTGNVTGFATTATNLNVANAETSTAHYLHFSPVATGSGVATSSDTALSYNPNTNVLTSPTFAGNLTGQVTGNVTGTATTAASVELRVGGNSVNHSVVFSLNATGTGVGLSTDTTLLYNPGTDTLSSTTFSGALTGNASTATTAINLNVNNADAATAHYLHFSPVATGSGVATSSDTALSYNPNTNVLTSPTFSGALSGNAGSATTAANVNVVTTADAALHYLLFTNRDGGSGVAVSTDPSVTLQPSNNILSVGSGQFAANGITVGSASNTINTASGNLTLDSVGGQTNINDNLVITGNLTVQGTTVTVDSTVSTIVDPVIVIGSGVGGTHSTADNNTDRGIEFRWSNSGTATTGFFGFNDTDGKFRFIPNATTAAGSNIYSGTAGTAVFLFVEATLSGNAAGTAATYTNFFGTHVGSVTGNVTGTATTAASVELRAGANAVNHSVVFSLNATGTGVGLSTDTALQYNPNSDTLSSTNFSGALTGNVTGFATTAINLNVNNADAATAHYLHFSPVATGSGVATSSDTALSYNPNTNVLTSPTFSGNLTGGVTGNVTGTATTAASIELRAGANSVNHSVVFSLNATGTGVGLSTDTTLLYNPGTDTLSSTTFSGALSGNAATATTAINLNVNNADAATAHYLHFSPVATGSGVATSSDTALSYNPNTNVLTASTFSGNLTGGVTGNVTGTATTAASIELRAGANSVNHSVVFSLNATGTGVGLSTDTTLLYNPGTDTLSSTTFSGALSGNAATATTAANLNVVSTTATGSHYLLFSPTSGGSGIAVSIDTTLTYVPSTDTLSVSTITPVTVTNSAALTSGTYLTVKTNASDDSSTSDFFIRGLTSADVSKFSVDANGNLRATTKSFDIPHPTKEGMRLVYGVLEGPEHGVYHRGTVEGKGNLLIELPDYWSELVNEDFSVTLTPHGNYGVHIVDKSLNSFIISLSGNLISKKFKVIKVDYLVHGSRKDAPLIVEQLY